MKKKTWLIWMAFLLAVSLVACAAPTPAPTPAPAPAPAPAPVVTGEVINWSLYDSSNPDAPTGTAWWWKYHYADEIYNVTDERLKITTYFRGEHPYAAADLLKAIEEVNPEIVEISCAKVAGTEPRLSVGDLPYFFPANADAYFKLVDDAIVPEFITPIFAKYGHQPLLTSVFPPQRLGVSGDFDLSSLKGQKIRVWNPQLGDLISLLGGIPVALSPGETYTSLATGLISGVISNSGAIANQYGEFLESIILSEFQFGLRSHTVSQDALEALPADVRDELLAWAEAKNAECRQAIHSYVAFATLEGSVKLGFSINPVSPAFVEETRDKCWESVWKPWIERAGGAGSPSADAFNNVAKLLIAAGHTVPNYEPY